MKILNVLPALNRGGVEMVVAESAIFLAQAGHESFVLSKGGNLITPLVKVGVKPICLPIEKKSLHSLFQIAKIARLIQDLKPDIVHTHSRLPAWLIYLALKLIPKTSRPITISTIHGLHSISKYSAITLKSDAVITVSHAAKTYYETHYLLKNPERYLSRIATENIRINNQAVYQSENTILDNSNNKNANETKHKQKKRDSTHNLMRNIHVFPLGVDLKKFTLKEDESDQIIKSKLLLIDPDFQKKPLIALVGRISRLKGHTFLIDAMLALKHKNIDANAIIVGGYDEKNIKYLNELKSNIQKKNLTDRIFFFGECAHMPALFRQINVTISVSTKAESYGRIVLESLRTGTPVIGWNIGGIGENLSQFYPDGLVPFMNQAELINCLIKTLKNQQPQILQLKEHNTNPKYTLSESITIDSSNHHRQVIDLYEKLIKNKHHIN